MEECNPQVAMFNETFSEKDSAVFCALHDQLASLDRHAQLFI